MGIRRESSGADHHISRAERKCMAALLVQPVPFERFGHALLLDEDSAADRPQPFAIRAPAGGTNDEGGSRHRRELYSGPDDVRPR
jgi:hypothetical protein